jgi:peptidyl-prolyl cis-trans isomerase SurA
MTTRRSKKPISIRQQSVGQTTARRKSYGLAAAALLCLIGTVGTASAQPSAATAVPAETLTAGQATVQQIKGNAKTSASKRRRAAQSIEVLVNDQPITGYEINQRAGLLAMSGGQNMGQRIQSRAKSRWKQIVKDPSLNDRFREILKKKNVKTREEAQKLQKTFIKNLQRDMVARIRREEQSRIRKGMRKKALDELIEEKLKLQEAKRNNLLADTAQVDKILTGIASKNKMDLNQFAAHLKRSGTNINSMRNRLRAMLSWQQVVRRRFGFQVAMLSRDVDRFMDQSGTPDDVELHVHRITVPLANRDNQQAMAERLQRAEQARATFQGCQTTPAVAASISGAKFEDLGKIKSSSVPEPTRSMLISAGEGDMLPPSLLGKTGIELWAVCSRNKIAMEVKKRTKEQGDIRQEEYGVLARKHLKDLQQDATIVYR